MWARISKNLRGCCWNWDTFQAMDLSLRVKPFQGTLTYSLEHPLASLELAAFPKLKDSWHPSSPLQIWESEATVTIPLATYVGKNIFFSFRVKESSIFHLTSKDLFRLSVSNSIKTPELKQLLICTPTPSCFSLLCVISTFIHFENFLRTSQIKSWPAA